MLQIPLAAQVPENPTIYSITITNENPKIIWYSNTDNITDGYTIYRGYYSGSIGPIWDSITSLFNVSDTVFIDNFISACDESQIYKVSAFNQFYDSNWGDAYLLKTIFLNPPVFDLCSNSVSLTWTQYTNMNPSIDGYRVLASTDDGAPFFEVDETLPGDTVFTHTNLLPDTDYIYKISAFYDQDSNRISESCLQPIESKTYPKPEYVKIISASVENNEYIKVDWETGPAVDLQSFVIERHPENQPAYTQVGSNTDLVNFSPATSFNDTLADFKKQSYYYQITMADFCGLSPLPYSLSDVHRTIHLHGVAQPDYTNYLEWNPYDGWDNDVDYYQIWRDTGTGLTELAQVSDTLYLDPVSDFANQGGVFTYYVEAFESGGNYASSKSNWITLEMETKIIVPNAFIPNSPDDHEFKPKVSYIKPGSYELLIFNKWGQMIFRSVDTETGWNGYVNNELQPPGAYVYLIKYSTPEGQNMEKRGTVTIIR